MYKHQGADYAPILSLCSFPQGFIESVCHHIKKLSEVERSIFEELAEWRHLQQRSLCGFPCPQALDKLQEMYVAT